jgi:hypothetical protein
MTLMNAAARVALLLAVAPCAFAQSTSDTVVFQGRLAGPGGAVPADGLYRIRFSIYAEDAGGTSLWSENQPSVQVTDGTSNTILFGENPAPPEIFTDWNSLWLEITVDTDNDGFEPEEIFSPRTPLHAVPIALYAKDAAKLSGVAAADYALKADVDFSIDALTSQVESDNAAQDLLIEAKANSDDVTAALADKADADDVTSALAGKADADTVNEALLLKADSATVQSQQELQDTAIAGKAELSSIVQWQVVTSGGVVPAQRNYGYVINTSQPVNVQLPLSASLGVGDIIRISGASLSGWVVNQNSGQRILSQSLPFPQIPSTWSSIESTRIWSSVACSADGRRVVACDGGSPGPVQGSLDGGKTWSQYLFGEFWRSVAMSADGQIILIGIDSPGVLVVSTDGGLNWIGREESRKWSGVAISADGTRMVATANLGGYIYTSDDTGVTWTQRESSRDWSGVASSADGSVLLACANPGQLYVSTDYGATWTPRATSMQWRDVAISADGSRMVAVPYGQQIYTSEDGGVSWNPKELNRNWDCVASSSNGQILAAGVISGNIHLSTDAGSTWSAVADSRVWRSIAMSADGSRIYGAAENTTLYTATAAIGTTGRVTSAGSGGGLRGSAYSAVELQYVGNDTFLPLSASGNVAVF